MFSTVRYFIKTSIAFLAVGLLSGLFMVISRDVFGWSFGYDMVSAHAHVILVGSVMMMIMGVALWFFPRAEKSDAKYRPGLILASYWMLTIGTAVRFTGQVVLAYSGPEFVRLVTAAAAAAQVVAIALFFWSNWGRIRPLGSAKREADGERF